MTSRSSALLVLATSLWLAGCGGGDPAATGGTTPAPAPAPAAEPAEAHAGEGGHGGHGKLTPELDAFHEILAPRWHAEAGPARTKDTCAAAAEFKTRAAAVKSAAAPAGASPTDWGEAGTTLVNTVASLEAACGGADQAAFDTAFTSVHDAFHRAMELAAGGHSHHEGGHH